MKSLCIFNKKIKENLQPHLATSQSETGTLSVEEK